MYITWKDPARVDESQSSRCPIQNCLGHEASMFAAVENPMIDILCSFTFASTCHTCLALNHPN